MSLCALAGLCQQLSDQGSSTPSSHRNFRTTIRLSGAATLIRHTDRLARSKVSNAGRSVPIGTSGSAARRPGRC
eukprot:5989305-Prymnesium_polylepis.1